MGLKIYKNRIRRMDKQIQRYTSSRAVKAQEIKKLKKELIKQLYINIKILVENKENYQEIDITNSHKPNLEYAEIELADNLYTGLDGIIEKDHTKSKEIYIELISRCENALSFKPSQIKYKKEIQNILNIATKELNEKSFNIEDQSLSFGD